MRWIIVPAPVHPRTLDGEQFVDGPAGTNARKIDEITMHRYLVGYILGERKIEGEGAQARVVGLKIGDGHEGMLRISKIDRAFSKAAPGDVVAVDADDWKRVKDIIEGRTFLESPYFGLQLLPLAEAWLEAKDEKEKALAEAKTKTANGSVSSAVAS